MEIVDPVAELVRNSHTEKIVSNFSLRARHLFLTYPQNSLEPKLLSERIQKSLDPEWSVVCQEEHDDEGLHLHALIRLKKRKYWYKANCFDELGGKHGNYQAARNVRALMKYVTKERGKIVSVGIDPIEFKRRAKKRKRCVDTKSSQASKIIDEGGNIRDVKKKFPGFFMMNMHKIRAYQTWVENERYKKGNYYTLI